MKENDFIIIPNYESTHQIWRRDDLFVHHKYEHKKIIRIMYLLAPIPLGVSVGPPSYLYGGRGGHGIGPAHGLR